MSSNLEAFRATLLANTAVRTGHLSVAPASPSRSSNLSHAAKTKQAAGIIAASRSVSSTPRSVAPQAEDTPRSFGRPGDMELSRLQDMHNFATILQKLTTIEARVSRLETGASETQGSPRRESWRGEREDRVKEDSGITGTKTLTSISTKINEHNQQIGKLMADMDEERNAVRLSSPICHSSRVVCTCCLCILHWRS